MKIKFSFALNCNHNLHTVIIDINVMAILGCIYIFLVINDCTTYIFNRKNKNLVHKFIYSFILGALKSTQGHIYTQRVKSIHTPTKIINSVVLKVSKCLLIKPFNVLSLVMIDNSQEFLCVQHKKELFDKYKYYFAID